MTDLQLKYIELEARLAESEKVIDALRNEDVDAVVGVKNVLLLRLKEVEDELKRHRDRLEQLVEERTADLAKANTELRQELKRRKMAEDKTHELSERLIKAHEEERRAVGRELHDQVGGSLTAMKLAVHRARQQQYQDTDNTLQDVEGMLSELMDEVRSLSQTLRPSMLDDLGLLEALLWYCQRYTTQTGIHVNFVHSGLNKRFPQEIETAAYRIVQESLTNVARYAGVDNVEVELLVTSARLNVVVEDRGKGFDPSCVRAEANGLRGMQDRVYLIGGKITIDSSPGAGTTIICQLPLKRKTSKKTGRIPTSTC